MSESDTPADKENHTENPDWTDEQAREEPTPRAKCVWCKCWPNESESVFLSTGERLCSNCLGDLREWKRTRFADMLVAPSLEDTIRSALLDDWQEMMDLLAQIHGDDPKLKTLPSRTSNANEHREHGDGTEGDRGD
jgi:hypothetical protein